MEADQQPSHRGRILLCSPVLQRGGTETYLLALVTLIRKAGWTPVICCYHECLPEVADDFQQAGARVSTLSLPRSRNPLPLVQALLGVVRQVRPVLAHVQYLAPAFTVIAALRRSGLRNIIATIHAADPSKVTTRQKFLLRAAAQLCTRFLAVSKTVEEFWFGSSRVWEPVTPLPPRRHLTVYNGVRIDRTKLSEQACNTIAASSRPRTIGVVGRLSREKGHAWLLEAFASANAKLPGISLMIVGDGPERTALHHRAAELGILPQIRWHGNCAPQECLQLYRQMDVFVLPSLTEGFGLAAAEAMGSGVPVIASRVGGLQELIGDGVSGWLVQSGNVGELSLRLILVLSDPNRAASVAQAALLRVAARFSLERFESAIRAIYEASIRNP